MSDDFDTLNDDFLIGDTKVMRRRLSLSMRDGTRLTGFLYSRENLPGRGRNLETRVQTPLLCLADELGNSREHHDFILNFLAQFGAPRKVYSFDLRGRGLSEATGVTNSSSQTDAEDLISLCDALGLHHCDILVSGRGVYPVILAAPSRPSMVRKLILNDASPEFDAVGIARLSTLSKRLSDPATWKEAADQLKQIKGVEFPDFDDDAWRVMAKTLWHEQDGKPVRSIAAGLVRLSNSDDYDSKQPALWDDFKLFSNCPVLQIRGQHSVLTTQELSSKLAQIHPDVTQIVQPDQGHVPVLSSGDLPQQILDFLQR